MIAHSTWRHLIYELSETNRDCLLLNYGIQQISEAGHDEEIASLPSASTYFSVFNRVLSDTVGKALSQPEWELSNVLADFARMYSHSEHTFVHTQAVLHELAESDPSGRLRRISQELHTLGTSSSSSGVSSSNATASTNLIAMDESGLMNMGEDAPTDEKEKFQFCQIAMLLMTSLGLYPALSAPILSVMRSSTPSPVDIRKIQQAFLKASAGTSGSTADSLPMAALIRNPPLLDKLIVALFNTQQEIPSEYVNSYLWVLAYASASKDKRSSYPFFPPRPPPPSFDITNLTNDPLINEIQEALTVVLSVCRRTSVGMAMQHTQEVIFSRIQFPIVSLLVLHWIHSCLCESEKVPSSWNMRFLSSQIEILQEIAFTHPLHHARCLGIIVDALSVESAVDPTTASMAKRKFVEFASYLMEHGCVLPVLQRLEVLSKSLDQSIVRHFLITTLEMAAAPYSLAFIEPIARMLSLVRIDATDQKATVGRFAEHLLKPGEYQLSTSIKEVLGAVLRNCKK